LNVKIDKLLSTSAFTFNLRRYSEGDVRDAAAAVAELTSRVSTRDADSRHRHKQREHELMAVRHPSSAYP
jgi:hypothetical protein